MESAELVAELWRRIEARDWDGVGDLLVDDYGRLSRAREYWVEEGHQTEVLPSDRSQWVEQL